MLNMYVFNTSIIVWIAINRYEWVLAKAREDTYY